VIGRMVEMHARFYAAAAGFGPVFESKVAAGLAEFVHRLDRSPNQLWSAVRDRAIVGTLATDGKDPGPGAAHLRWFIVEEGLRGSGTGRRLYESSGFVVTQEQAGWQWGREVIEQQFVRPAPPRVRTRRRAKLPRSSPCLPRSDVDGDNNEDASTNIRHTRP
jgi:hypothetical protein